MENLKFFTALIYAFAPILILFAVVLIIGNVRGRGKDSKYYKKEHGRETLDTFPADVSVGTAKILYRRARLNAFIHGAYPNCKSWSIRGNINNVFFLDDLWNHKSKGGRGYLDIDLFDGTSLTRKYRVEPKTEKIYWDDESPEDKDESQTPEEKTSESAIDTKKTLKDAANKFLEREDVRNALDKGGTISANLPEEDVLSFVKRYLLKEHGIEFCQMDNGNLFVCP